MTDWSLSDALHQSLAQQLIESGEMEVLRQSLLERLDESGWIDNVELMCKDAVRKHGMDVSVNDLIGSVLTEAQTLVPPTVTAAMHEQTKAAVKRLQETP